MRRKCTFDDDDANGIVHPGPALESHEIENEILNLKKKLKSLQTSISIATNAVTMVKNNIVTSSIHLNMGALRNNALDKHIFAIAHLYKSLKLDVKIAKFFKNGAVVQTVAVGRIASSTNHASIEILTDVENTKKMSALVRKKKNTSEINVFKFTMRNFLQHQTTKKYKKDFRGFCLNNGFLNFNPRFLTFHSELKDFFNQDIVRLILEYLNNT